MGDLQHGDVGVDRLEEPVTRRRVLRSLGGLGLAATASAGITGLFGARPAYASATATAPTGSGFPPQIVVQPDCACKTLCSLNTGHCDGACPSGEWCYHCNGCGLNGNICLTGCNGAANCYWCT